MLGLGRRESNRIEARLGALKSDFDALQRDFAGLADGVQTVAKKRGAQLYSAGEDWTDENLGDLREAIREQPLAASLIILGAGALLGAILLRR